MPLFWFLLQYTSCACSKPSHKWYYTVSAHLCLAPATQHNVFEILHITEHIGSVFSFIAELCEYATTCWSIRLLTDTWAVSTSWLLWWKLLYFCTSLSIDINFGFSQLNCWDNRVGKCLSLEETYKPFPKMVALFYSFTNNVCKFRLLHILMNICYSQPNYSHFSGSMVICHCSFNLHFLDNYNVDHILIDLFAICISSFMKNLFKYVLYFLIGLFIRTLWPGCKSFDICIANILLSVTCIFIFLRVNFYKCKF